MQIIQTVRLQLKKSFDRIRNENLKRSLLQAVPFWMASIATGLVAVLYTKLFVAAENLSVLIFSHYAWGLFIVTPACFVLAWWLARHFAPFAKGSGIPQVIAAIQLSNKKTDNGVSKLLSLKIIIVKIASSLVMALGGGAVGREGPTIQIASSIYKMVYHLLPKWWPKIAKQNMIVTGAAAGLAAAFNTPLGGIVFAIEELTKTHFSYFKTAIFSSVIIAGLTAQALLGPYLYLGYPKTDNLAPFIFAGVILVAFITGMVGSAMSKIIWAIFVWKDTFTLKAHHIAYVLAAAFLMAFMAYFINMGVLGSGKELMETTLFTSEKYVAWYVPLLRVIGPVLSFTTGGAGGVFAPALSAGASIGSLVSSWFNLPGNDTNLLILAGMVGFLTGVTRSPFTCVILVLEMTNNHNVIFHLILSGMVASLISLFVDKHSLYDRLKAKYVMECQEAALD